MVGNEITVAMLVFTLMVRGPVFGQISTSGSADPHVYKTIPAEEEWSFLTGSLIAAANGSRARYVGDRPGTEVHWQATRHLWFQVDYGLFHAGRFLKEAGPDKNLNYSALYLGYRF